MQLPFKETEIVTDYLARHVVPEITYSRAAIAIAMIQLGTAMLAQDNPRFYGVVMGGILEAMSKTAYRGGKP